MWIVYLDNYAAAEASTLTSLGIQVAQGIPAQAPAAASTQVIVRGPKMSADSYATIVAAIEKASMSASTSAADYASLTNPEVFEAAIKEFVPEKKIFRVTSFNDVAAGLAALKDWRKVFIRSNLGSVAKFEGFGGCVISEFTPSEIQEKVGHIAKHFPSADRIVASKVENIREANGKRAEGRFVILSSRVRYLDHCELGEGELQHSFEAANMKNAAQVAEALAANGIRGDYFLDIAERVDGGWFVVEIKPLVNGSIRNVDRFAKALSEPV